MELEGTRRQGAGGAKPSLWLVCHNAVDAEEILKALRGSAFDVVTYTCSLTADPNRNALLALVVACESERCQLVSQIRTLHPTLPLLVVVESLRDSVAFPLLLLGVQGLVLCTELPRYLARAASMVASGGYWIPRLVLDRFGHAVPPECRPQRSLETVPELSAREREVLSLVLENLRNTEIASQLGLSERAIKFHVSRLLRKFRVGRRSDLITFWPHSTAHDRRADHQGDQCEVSDRPREQQARPV